MRTAVALAGVVLLSSALTLARQPALGSVSFENSGAPAAQESFLAGLAQLHNFEYPAAADLFRRAQQIDPGFAMAYWGEAMTYNHPVWMEQDRGAARKALARLAPTREARVGRAKTPREQAYIRAVEILYGDADKQACDLAYADAMAELHRTYPDDPDAAAFYALALLGTAHEGRDFTLYMRAAAIVEPVFRDHPNHPGAALPDSLLRRPGSRAARAEGCAGVLQNRAVCRSRAAHDVAHLRGPRDVERRRDRERSGDQGRRCWPHRARARRCRLRTLQLLARVRLPTAAALRRRTNAGCEVPCGRHALDRGRSTGWTADAGPR
jgi:tetratricopeptide (TPR) repeat protein